MGYHPCSPPRVLTECAARAILHSPLTGRVRINPHPRSTLCRIPYRILPAGIGEAQRLMIRLPRCVEPPADTLHLAVGKQQRRPDDADLAMAVKERQQRHIPIRLRRVAVLVEEEKHLTPRPLRRLVAVPGKTLIEMRPLAAWPQAQRPVVFCAAVVLHQHRG